MPDGVKNYVHLEFPSDPENVGVARVLVASFAAQLDFTLEEIDEIRVATSEAVSNAIIHGYVHSPGMVSVRVNLYENLLEIIVEDQGVGIEDIALASQPSFSTDPERMGLGLVFMDSFMDKLEIDSAPGRGTRVRMLKSPQQTAGRNRN
ncbi:MAG: anti-sigma F factor [Firmicutes bacterium]|nr:anti-sigma F factor [Bacillota bacterium]